MVCSQRVIRVDTPSTNDNNLSEKRAQNPMFGNRNEAEVSAARRDFECYTLMGVPTLFGKLAYLDELRADAAERYQHWGLEKIFGSTQVADALAEVHGLLGRELLSTRLQSLLQDLKSRQLRDEVPDPRHLVLVRDLQPPACMSDAEQHHFRLTLDTLKLLNQHSRPGA